MRTKRTLVFLLAGLALALASCGGESADTQTTLSGAEIVPADAPLFASIQTDLESEQWQAAQDLLSKFPDGDRLLVELKNNLADEDVDFERDIRPVLGPDIGIAWLDVEDDDTVVGFMQPEDPARLNALLEKSDEPLLHTEIDGWTAFSDSQAALDRLRSAQGGEKLSESDDFDEALEGLPEDSILTLYAGGPQVRKAVADAIAEQGVPQGFGGSLDDFRSFALAVTAEQEGIRFEADVVAGSDSEFETYEPQLPDTLPEGALLYFSFANLDGPARELLSSVEEAVPNFDEQRRQAEQAFGFSIESDLLPLLADEGAFAIYPGPAGELPTFVLALAGDEEKAVELMDKLGSLLELGGEGSGTEQEIEGITLKELQIEGQSIFYAAVGDVFVASNTREGVLEANSDGPKLSDDEQYQSAREGAEAEGDTIAFLYANLEEGLPYALDFAEEEGESVPPEAQANIEPLKSLFLSTAQDGNRFELSGFLSIE